MMIKLPIVIGVGVSVAVLLLCCVCWGVWKLRQCMKTGQVSASLDEILVENRKGLKKEVVRTFPIVKTSDLNVDTNSKLQCPICWLEFRDADTMRQLPQCDHLFHRRCIDPVLAKQTSCPVCGTVLTDNPKASEGRSPNHRQVPLRSLYSKNPSSPKAETPPWVLVNQPVPLPRTAVHTSSSSSDRFEIELNPYDSQGSSESPLLKYLNVSHDVVDYSSVDLDQTVIDISFTFGTDIPVEKRQPGTHSTTTNDKGLDSFSFSTDAFKFITGLQEPADAPPAPGTAFRSTLRSSRSKESSSFSDSNASTRFSRSTSRSSRSITSSSDSSFKQLASWEYAHPHASDHLPLTNPPDQCAFDVLPVITGSREHTLRPPQTSRDYAKIGANRNTYSQL